MDWIDELCNGFGNEEDNYYLYDFIDKNLQNTTIGHEEQARIFRELNEYTTEELKQIINKIKANYLNAFTEVGRYGMTQRYIYW